MSDWSPEREWVYYGHTLNMSPRIGLASKRLLRYISLKISLTAIDALASTDGYLWFCFFHASTCVLTSALFLSERSWLDRAVASAYSLASLWRSSAFCRWRTSSFFRSSLALADFLDRNQDPFFFKYKIKNSAKKHWMCTHTRGTFSLLDIQNFQNYTYIFSIKNQCYMKMINN